MGNAASGYQRLPGLPGGGGNNPIFPNRITRYGMGFTQGGRAPWGAANMYLTSLYSLIGAIALAGTGEMDLMRGPSSTPGFISSTGSAPGWDDPRHGPLSRLIRALPGPGGSGRSPQSRFERIESRERFPNMMMELKKLLKKKKPYYVLRNHEITRPIWDRQRDHIDKPEYKFVDILSTVYNCDTTGTVVHLNGIGSGTLQTERTGYEVTNRNVQIRGMVKAQSATTHAHYVRIMVVYEPSPTSYALPPLHNILSETSAISFSNRQHGYRFITIVDREFAVGARSSTVADSPTVWPVKIFHKLNLPTIFGGAFNGNVTYGRLLLVCVGSVPAPNASVFHCASRVKFRDGKPIAPRNSNQ